MRAAGIGDPAALYFTRFFKGMWNVEKINTKYRKKDYHFQKNSV